MLGEAIIYVANRKSGNAWLALECCIDTLGYTEDQKSRVAEFSVLNVSVGGR